MGLFIWTLSDPMVEEVPNIFGEENFIGNFQFGKVYRGKFMGKEVTVKVWQEDDQSLYKILPGDNKSRISDELTLHKDFRDYDGSKKLNFSEYKPHPNIAHLLGKHMAMDGKYLATVYELDALDTLHNLLLKIISHGHKGSKLLLGLHLLLNFFHSQNPPYLIRNFCSQHIMLDQEHNPKLYDLSMISGGILTDRRNLLNQYVDGCHGYVDPVWARPGYSTFLVKEMGPQLITVYLNTKSGLFWKGFSLKTHQKIIKSFTEKSHFNDAGTQSSKEDCSMIEAFTYEDLSMLTDGFNRENLIGKFQFGKLFHGKLNGRQVTVKIWEIPAIYSVLPQQNEQRLRRLHVI